jgi:thiamine-phosphate pyrophosphorylase
VSARSNPRGSRTPILCYVTDRRTLAEATATSLTRKIDEVLAAGVDWVQIRERDLSARELATLALRAFDSVAARSGARNPPARIIVNDRLDVALAHGAQGVHLGENSVPVEEAARWVASYTQCRDFLLGVSCHALEAAKAAAAAGADYLFFGPIFATPAKAAFGPPQGVGRLAEVCREVSIPVLAIGGITAENARQCWLAGAAGIAAIRLFQDSRDPAAVVDALRAGL